MSSYLFSKQSRLLNPAAFRAVFKAGRRLRRGPFQFLACPNKVRRPRLGIAISKRNVRHAHARNLIKRLTRESFRLNQASLPDIDIVVLINAGADDYGRRRLRADLEGAWPALARMSDGPVARPAC